MPYAMLYGNCGACGKGFGCNHNLVPSLWHEGNQLIFCEPCVNEANIERSKNGLDPIEIKAGAYDSYAEVD